MKTPSASTLAHRRALIALASTVLLSAPTAHAFTYDWTGTTNGNMSGTAANWGGTTPTGTDIALWNAATYTNAPTANASMTIGQLLFDAGNTAGVTFGAGTSTLTLNGISGVGIQLNSGSGAVSTGSAKFSLGADQSWINNSANTLTVAGTITNASTTISRTLTIDGSGSTILSGIISNSGTGLTTITKTGNGTLTLGNTNTFTGGLNIQQGTVKLGILGAAGSGLITIGSVGNSAILDLNSSGSRAINSLATAGTAADQKITNSAATAATVNYTGATTSTFGGVIENGSSGGTTAVTVNNASAVLTLSGANTYTGLTTVTAGTLKIGATNAINSGNALTTAAAGTFDLNGYDQTIGTLVNGGTITNSSDTTKTLTFGSATVASGSGSFTGAMNVIFTTTSSNGALAASWSNTGSITLNINGTNTITLSGTSINNTGTITNSGSGVGPLVISGNIGSNVGLITQNSATSTLTLSGTNTNAGGVTLTTGTLKLGSTTALGATASTLTIAAGTTLDSTVASLVLANNNALNLNGSFTFTGTQSLNLGTGAVTIAGPLTLTTTANTMAFGGAISGGTIFDITKAGSGTLAYNGAITLSSTPTLTVNTGTVALGGIVSGGNGIFDIVKAGSGTLNYTRDITLSGTQSVTNINVGTEILSGVLSGSGGLTLASVGTLNLSGNNTYTGATTISSGTLKLSGTNGSLGASAITVTKQTILNFDSSAANTTGTTRAASVTLRGGSLTLNGNSGANSTDTVTGTINIDGNSSVNGMNFISLTANGSKNAALTAASLTRSNGGVVQISGSNLGATPGNGVANFTVTTAPTLVGTGSAGTTSVKIIPWAIGSTTVGGFTDFITYDTNGFRPLTSSEYVNFTTTGNFTGTAAGDNVKITSAGTAVTMTLTAPTTVNSLYMSTSGSSSTLTGSTITVTSGAVFLTNGNTSVTIASNLDFSTAQGVIGYGRGKATTITGNISGSNGLVLYQIGGPPSAFSSGSGVNLSGASSTYTGDTYIIGRVDVSANNVLPNSANGPRSGNIFLYGMLNFTGNALTLNGLSGDGLLNDSSSGAGTLTIGDNNADGAFSGVITESGGLSIVKIGSGTQTIASTQTYTGATTIRGGTLETTTLDNGGAVSGIGKSTNVAANLVINGGTLKYSGAATSTDRLFKVGEATTGSTATLDASGTGAVNFTNMGALTYGTAGTTGTAQTRTLVLTGSNTGANTLSALIGNNGVAANGNSAVSLTKTGSGSWTLSATNSYTGATTVSAGTLIVSGSIASSATTVGSGATFALSGSGIAGNVTVNSGTFQLGTAGTAGAVTINSGTFGGVGTVNSLAFTGTSTFGPGNSPGTVTIADGGSFTLSSGTTSTFQFTDSLFTGGTYDLVTTAGTATGTIAGTLNLDFTGSGYTAGSNVTFINLSSISGTFTTINVTGLSGLIANIIYNNANGDVSLSLASAIPEPSTYALLLGASGILFAATRRRRRSA